MANITRSSFAKALYPGVSKWYGKAYKDYKPEWKQLGFEEINPKRAYIEDVGMVGLGLAQVKSEGGTIYYDEEKQGYITRYIPVVYAIGYTITREMWEDNLYSEIGLRRSTGLARSMRQTEETTHADVFNNGFSTTYTGGDGSALMATDHTPYGGGTDQRNKPSTDVDLSEAALEQAVIDIADWKDERGLKIAVKPTRLTVPTALQFEACRILKSVGQVYSADNTPNALMQSGMFPKGYNVNHWLTDTNAWFVGTDSPRGLISFQRRAMEFTIDNDHDTQNAKFAATKRWTQGWTDWRCLYGSSGG